MTRDELYEYFITENHTRKDTAQYFGLTEGKLRTLLSKLGIVKPKELSSKNNTSSPISGRVKYTNGLATKYFIEGEQEEGFTKATNFATKESPKPSLHWFNLVTGKHVTDNLLRQRGFDQLFGTNYGKGASNEELMLKNGFVKVYDCGQASFTWHKKC